MLLENTLLETIKKALTIQNALKYRDGHFEVFPKFQTHFKDRYLRHFLWKCSEVNATRPLNSWLTKYGAVVMQQVIAWINVDPDLCRYIASLATMGRQKYICLRHLSNCVYKICLCLCHLYWHYRHIRINLILSVYHKWLYFVRVLPVCVIGKLTLPSSLWCKAHLSRQ